MESGVVRWSKFGVEMEIGDDERYQRDYLYRRGGIPKGRAGHHVERMNLLRGSLLDLPSSSVFVRGEFSVSLLFP
jgi:hypothetical protein